MYVRPMNDPEDFFLKIDPQKLKKWFDQKKKWKIVYNNCESHKMGAAKNTQWMLVVWEMACLGICWRQVGAI